MRVHIQNHTGSIAKSDLYTGESTLVKGQFGLSSSIFVNMSGNPIDESHFTIESLPILTPAAKVLLTIDSFNWWGVLILEYNNQSLLPDDVNKIPQELEWKDKGVLVGPGIRWKYSIVLCLDHAPIIVAFHQISQTGEKKLAVYDRTRKVWEILGIGPELGKGYFWTTLYRKKPKIPKLESINKRRMLRNRLKNLGS